MRSLALCSVLIFDAQSSVSSIHVCRFHILYIGRCIVLTLTVLFLSECVCSVFFLLLLLLLLVVMLLFWFAHACLTRTHTLTAINSLLYEATSATCKCLKFSGIFTIYQLLCSRRLSLSLFSYYLHTFRMCIRWVLLSFGPFFLCLRFFLSSDSVLRRFTAFFECTFFNQMHSIPLNSNVIRI